VKKFIGAYTASMGGLDALVFTGGIGENAVEVREEICSDLEYLGIKLDSLKNQNNEKIISDGSSKVKVFRIQTNEELVIALDTAKIVSESVQ
jgi:acetate kinase